MFHSRIRKYSNTRLALGGTRMINNPDVNIQNWEVGAVKVDTGFRFVVCPTQESVEAALELDLSLVNCVVLEQGLDDSKVEGIATIFYTNGKSIDVIDKFAKEHNINKYVVSTNAYLASDNKANI